MLERFDKASSSELEAALTELEMHSQLLKMVKADMDAIYHSIRYENSQNGLYVNNGTIVSCAI